MISINLQMFCSRTINNAWCAVPLCWYNEIDNRSERKLEDAIKENQRS